jgi:hypothetical protein
MQPAASLPSHICPYCHVQYFQAGKCDWDGVTLWPIEHAAQPSKPATQGES